MDFEIQHQQQPTLQSCTHTCLAMLLNEPIDKVARVMGFDLNRGMEHVETMQALARCGFSWNRFVLGWLVADGYYMLTVPSLNNAAGNHSIVVRIGDHQMVEVHDPNMGNPLKRYYSLGQETASTKLPIRWSEPYYVVPGGRLPTPSINRGV